MFNLFRRKKPQSQEPDRPITKADLHRAYGDYENAIKEWENQLQMARQSGVKQDQSHLLIMLGAYYAKTGNLPKGLDYIEQGLKLAEEIGASETVMQAHIELGVIRFGQDQSSQALEHFRQVVALARALHHPGYEHRGLGNIGAIQGAAGQYKESLATLLQASELAQATGDKPEEAQYARQMGLAAFHLREGGQALMHLDHYQALCKEIGQTPDPRALSLAKEIRAIYQKRSAG